MRPDYRNIPIAGGDTAQPLALQKRLDFIRRHVSPGGGRFFDGGCGAGDYVFALIEQLGMDAHGVEYDPGKVEQARRHPRYGDRISQGDLQTLPLESGQWDYAMLNEVLEHVPHELTALREIHRILKPGGLLFVFSPNRWFPFETHGVNWRRSGRRLPPAVPFVPYLPLGFGNRFFEYWARNYWHGELRQLLVSGGFSVIDTGYLWQTFEGISGRQPKLIGKIKPVLRRVANTLESLPLVNRFGVSQALVCRK